MWYDMVARQADNDMVKMEKLWKMPLKGLLNHLSYLMSKSKTKRN